MRLLAYFCIVSFSCAVSMSFYSLILPLFAKDLGAGLFAIGLLSSVFSLACFFASSALDFLSDLFLKRKPFVFWGLVATGVLIALNGFASSYEQVFALSILAGIATSISPIFLAMFSELIKKHFRAEFGFFSAAGSAGAGVGLVIGGLLAEALGLRAVFLVAGILYLLFAVLFRVLIPEPRYVQADEKDAPIPRGVYAVYAAAFLRHTCASGLWAVFPIYLQRFSTSLSEIGVLYAVNALLQPPLMLLISKTTDKFSRLAVFTAGLVASLAAFLVFAVASDVVHVLAGQALVALSWSCITLGANEYVLEKTAVKKHAEAEGFLNSSFLLAAVVGGALGGLLAQAYGFTAMLVALSALTAASIIIAAVLLRRETRTTHRNV